MKKLLLLMFFSILLVGSVSAILETKSFDKNVGQYGEIKINDMLLFNKIDYRLTDYQASVIDAWAEGEYTAYKDSVLFDGLFLKDVEGKKLSLRDAKYFYWVNENYTVKVPTGYELVCNENGTVCQDQALKYNDELRVKSYWKEYTLGSKVPSGEGKWRIEGKRPKNQAVDFIIEASGKEFTEWAWWDASWNKKRAILYNFSTGTETGYEARVNVTYDSDMQTDFDDLRFINLAETTELKYWIEAKVDSSWALVWFNATDPINTTNVTVAYMYYGNGAVSNNSNASQTFVFGDDFSTNTTTTYTLKGGSQPLKWNNAGYVYVDTSTGGGLQYFNPNPNVSISDNQRVITRVYINTTGDQARVFAGFTNATDTSWALVRGIWDSANFTYEQIANGAGSNPQSNWTSQVSAGNFYSTQVVKNGAVFSSWDAYKGSNQSYSTNLTFAGNYTFANSITSPQLSLVTRKLVSVVSWDYLLVGKYHGGTEAYSFGAEVDFVPSLLVTSTSPANNSNFTNTQVSFVGNVSPDSSGITVANVSLLINGTTNQTNTSTLSGIYNFSVNLNDGYYNWTLIAFGNDSSQYNSSNGTLFITRSNVYYNSFTYNSTTSETSNETFFSNVTTNGTTPSNAYLNYNGTLYTATVTSTSGNYFNISQSIDIPTVNQSKPFYFITTLSGVNYTSGIQNQTVNSTVFTICNTTYTTPFINYTFQDETNSTVLSAAVNSYSINYYLGGGTTYKSYTFSNTSANLNYTFCGSPNQTIITNYNVSYSATNYPQRNLGQQIDLTNSMTTKVLYLLGSADGVFENIQVINSAEQPLSGVSLIVSRTIGSTDTIMGTGITPSNGVITFWLNPLFLHTVNASKTGFDSESSTWFPTGQGITLQMGGAATNVSNDYTKGITYSVLPSASTSLNNGTVYAFNFTISSSYWDLDAFGFNITNGTVTYATNSSTSSSGGTINVNVNTSSNSSFIMNYYWTINSTNITGSTSWIILDLSESSWSIANLIQDFVLYVASGLFGLDTFGIGLTCFLLIVVITGILSLKFGVTSPATLLGITFGLVLFFDVGVGLMPNPIGAISHFPTIFVGIVLVGVILKEVYN